MRAIIVWTPRYEKVWLPARSIDGPAEKSNCLPIEKADLEKFYPFIDRLGIMINEAKERAEIEAKEIAARYSGTTNEQDIATQLEKVAKLYESGALSKEEYEISKRRILGIG